MTVVKKLCTTGQRHKKAVSFRGILKVFFCFRADNKIVYIEKHLRIPKHGTAMYFISSFAVKERNATDTYKKFPLHRSISSMI